MMLIPEQKFKMLEDFFHGPGILRGIVELTEDNILHLYDNEYTAQFFGTTIEAMEGRLASELGAPEEVVKLWRHHYLLSQKSGKPESFEYDHVTPDAQFVLQANVSYLGPGEEGRPRFSYEVFDVTSRKHYEQSLINARNASDEANQAKSRFLRNISHELRTPLYAISGFADILKDHLSGEGANYIQLIKNSSDMLSDLLSQVLDITRLEAGKITTHLAPVNISKLTAEIQLYFQMGQLSDQVQLIVDYPDGSIDHNLLLDGLLLKQILTNLVGNACKFTDHGSIKIETRYLAGQELLDLIILDTGIGIPAQDLNQITEPFFQSVQNQSRLIRPGLGLGLTIVRGLVEHLNGSFAIESKPDQGTRVHIQLPAASTDKEAEQTDPDPVFTEIPLKVLLVEDNQINQIVTRKLLEKFGCQVSLAGNGDEAIQLAAREKFEAIIMDIRMPGKDGLETVQLIRNQHTNRNTPVVALTADATTELRSKCLDTGMDYYLSKPVNSIQIGNILKQIQDSMDQA